MTVETTHAEMDADSARRLTERIRQAARELSFASASRRGAARPAAPERHLYLMQLGEDGPVKIGSAGDVAARRATIQTGSPYPVHVRFVLTGLACREREMHLRFRYFRISGEWFEPIPEIFDWFRLEAI